MQIVFTLPMRNSRLSKKQPLGYGFGISFVLQIPVTPTIACANRESLGSSSAGERLFAAGVSES